MLLRAVGGLLPEAIAVALSPFPVIAVVLLLGATQGRRNGLMFAIGWLIGLSALTTATLLFSSATDADDGTSSTLVDILRVAFGLLLIAMAVKTWRTRPRAGEEAEMPGWMAALDTATPSKSLLIGLGLAGLNVKNVALTVSAAATITDLTAAGGDTVFAAVVYLVLASSFVIGIVGYAIASGPRADATLDSVKRFMLANNAVIMMVVLLVLGAKILGAGLGGLGD